MFNKEQVSGQAEDGNNSPSSFQKGWNSLPSKGPRPSCLCVFEAVLRQINTQGLPWAANPSGEEKCQGLSDTDPDRDVFKQLLKAEELRSHQAAEGGEFHHLNVC